MQLCKCPVCGSTPVFTHDDKGDVLLCPECKKRGLTIAIYKKDNMKVEDICQLWNTRPLHNIFIEDYDYLHKFFKLENKNLSMQERQELCSELQSLDKKWAFYNELFGLEYSPCFGFFVLKNGNLIRCIKDHFDTLLSIFNIETLQKDKENYDENFIMEKALRGGVNKVYIFL